MKHILNTIFKFNNGGAFTLLFIIITMVITILYRYPPYFNKYYFKPSPKYYGIIALNIIGQYALYAEGDDWKLIKKKILKEIRKCKSYRETLPFISEALKAAGGRHSSVIKNTQTVESQPPIEYPTAYNTDQYLYINIPRFAGVTEKAQIFKDMIEHSLINSKNENIIIDLRDNSGGDMGPMITGLSSLLNEGHLISFIFNQNNEFKVHIKNGEVIGGGSHVNVKQRRYISMSKIAVLIGANTASSGEITALSFNGMPNVKTFGRKSAGFTSSNQSIPLYDDIILNITSAKLKTKTGTIYENDPILPDIESESPYDSAVRWFNKN